MRMLYCAIDQKVPGTLGGSVHTRSVADGLAALGHDVHVLASRGDGPFPAGPVRWHAMAPPLGRPQLAGCGRARSWRSRGRSHPTSSSSGTTTSAARASGRRATPGRRAVLEVNAPIVDHAGLGQGPPRPAAARATDGAVAGVVVRAHRPLRDARARRSCRPTCRALASSRSNGARIPTASVPARPARCRSSGRRRSWPCSPARSAPGMGRFTSCARSPHCGPAAAPTSGRCSSATDRSGPPCATRRGASTASSSRGPCRTSAMPAALAAADIGVAPFDPARHAALSLAFYWSPLKVFEYMASGLPVVAPHIDRLAHARGARPRGRPLRRDRARCARRRAGDARVRRDTATRLGAAARVRAERDFSWRAHCASARRRDPRPAAAGGAPLACAS